MNKFEATLEHWVFRSRWLLAPFFIGLLLGSSRCSSNS
jgi:uncharacterized membrane protein YqhA